MAARKSKNLKDALAKGLGVVTRVWDYKVKDWVTSVFAADIDHDGEAEVIACARDGRVYCLKSSNGDERWARILPKKVWVGTGVTGDAFSGGGEAHIIVGTRDSFVYVLEKDGKTLTKEGQALAYDKEGRALDIETDKNASWYSTNDVIRQVYVDPLNPSTIVIGSEDRSAYGIDYKTGNLRWKYPTNGWVRAVFSVDINGDGKPETLLGSTDKFLYILNSEGQFIDKCDMKFPVHTITAADIDNDGRVEILAGTDGKDLAALTFDTACGFTEKWRKRFPNRLLSLCVTDIDNDGRLEIIAGSEDRYIYTLDTKGEIIWLHNHHHRIYSIFPMDIDNDVDKIPELLIGSDNNVVRAMRVRLQKGLKRDILRYYKRLKEPDLSTLTDLNTAERELLRDVLNKWERQFVTLQRAEELLHARNYQAALAILLRLQQQRVQQPWRKKTKGHTRSVCFRQALDDPHREIVIGTSEGDVLIYGASGQLKWHEHISDRVLELQTGFLDRNRKEEIVIANSDSHISIISGTRKRKRENVSINSRMSSISLTAPRKSHGYAEIIIGSEEKKLFIYRGDLKHTPDTIDTQEGIRIVRTHTPDEEHITSIVAASLSNRVYAYSRNQKDYAWMYETRDHIRAICLKDINGDGQFEVLIGSEDRNLHVLDHHGNLLWRYFLPHSVLCIDAVDIKRDGEGKCEIFVGCADSYLYVLNSNGEFQWKYRADDRIHAVRVEDIDKDGNFEIALGSEDELELLRLVNQQELQTLIEQCWASLLEQQPLEQAIHDLLFRRPGDPYLQSFALSKLVQLHSFSSEDFSLLEQLAKEGAFEVRQFIAGLLVSHGERIPLDMASHILYQLSLDPEQDVRNTVVEHIPAFIRQDWKSGFSYLERFSENDNRHIRRLIMLKLYQVIDMQQVELELTSERQQAIFNLLLAGVLDKDSEWVRQEAARTLAHFLDLYPGRLIVNTQLLIVRQVDSKIFKRIAHCASLPFVKRYLNAVIEVLEGVTDENALERVKQVVTALDGGATGLSYSHDIRSLYDELRHVLTLRSIEAIAHYQCMLKESQFAPNNEFAPIMLAVFREFSSITHTLRIYLRREGVQDRLNSLLDATKAIDRMKQSLEDQYSKKLMGVSITTLPDHIIFQLALARWQRLVNEQINELRGKAKIEARLQENQARFDDVVAIWLYVCNAGNSSADELKITMLDGSGFTAIGGKTAERETLVPGEDATFEFLLKPEKSLLDLRFEIVYSDGDNPLQITYIDEQLELSESYREYVYVANPYSTGTPMHDREMFYGREKVMAYLQDNLTRKPKTVIVLFGQRRSGKTTVLLQLIKHNAFGEHVPVLIDLQAISYNMSIQSFLHRVANYIYRAMKERNLLICEPKMDDFRDDPMSGFDRFLDSVEERLDGRKLIWLVDEFEVLEDQVDKGRLEPEIFQYLRNIVQHRQSINILFSGTHQITEYTRLYHSVFFNIADHYRLSKISPEGAAALITKPIDGFLEYEPLSVTKIRQLADDQPYLIHLLCRAIVDYCNENRKPYVTINDVNVVLGKVMSNGQYHFSWLWDQVGTEEHMVLSTLAYGGKEDGRWLTLYEIGEIYQQHLIPFKRHYVLDALKTLIDADVVESVSSDSREATLDNHKFRVPVGLSRRWLLREHPLGMTKVGLSE